MHRRRLTQLACGAALGLVLDVGPAAAQTPADQTSSVTEVVVTAEKRSERLQDVPLAVTALNGEFLERSGARNFEDLTQYTPSLHFNEAQSPGQADITIRGVGSSGGSAGLEPSVGIYQDGVYLDRTFFGIGDFTDVARVEVLRGPQGTLFGKNTPAGLVNFITEPPAFTFGGNARATFGNYDTRQFAGSITGPVAGDVLALRLSAFSSYHSGYIRNDFDGSQVNDNDSWGVRGKALYKPNDKLDVTLTLEHGEVEQNCCAAVYGQIGASALGVAAALGKPYPSAILHSYNQTDFNGRFHYQHKINAVTVQANYALGPNTLTSITSYRTYNEKGFIDADFSQIDFLPDLGGNRQIEQLSQELRIASPTGSRIEYTAGLYYFHKLGKEEDYAETGTDTPAILKIVGLGSLAPLYATPRTEVGGSTILTNSYAAFGQAKWRITEKASVTGGLRYTYDNKSVADFNRTSEIVPVLFRNYNEQGSHAGGNLSGTVNGEYRFTRDLMTYASFTRGYKSFGFNDGYVDTSLNQQRFFKAELSNDVEVGTKGTIIDRRLTFDIDLFHTNYTNFQSLGYTGTVFLLQNAPSLTSQGIEIGLTAKPVPGLDFTSATTILDAKFNSFPNGPGVDNAVQDLSGRTLANAPHFAQSFVAAYRHSIADKYDAYIQADVLYRTKAYTNQNLDPLLLQKSYALVNANIGIEREDGLICIQLWAKNLTNTRYFEVGAEPPAVYTVGTRIRFVGAPATYGVTLSSRF